MGNRVARSLGLVTAAVALLWVSAPGAQQSTGQAPGPSPATASAKSWEPPRTPDGRPDLQGVWVNNSATPLERPKALEGRAQLTDEEVRELEKRAARIFDANGGSDFAGGDAVFLAALANAETFRNPDSTSSALVMVEREFDNRTSLIVDPSDGRVPPLTPAAQQARAAAAAQRRPPEGPEDLNNFLRCLSVGVPRLGGNASSYNSYAQILQTPGHVAILSEMIHDARVIPLDARPHLASDVRQWHGDSRGRWEGDTLVVETTNYSPKSNVMGSAEHLHATERFTRVAPDTINYEIILTDETTWTKPWTAVVHLKQTRDRLFEYACHEGNRDVMESILGGARAEERSQHAGRARGAGRAPR